MKSSSICRKQKRWWNAYMLFYTRNDYESMGLEDQMKALDLSSAQTTGVMPKMPAPIQKSIQKQNVRFLHHRNQFSPEYFQVLHLAHWFTGGCLSTCSNEMRSLRLYILFPVYAQDHGVQHAGRRRGRRRVVG